MQSLTQAKTSAAATSEYAGTDLFELGRCVDGMAAMAGYACMSRWG
jgi:hypothetical protein